MQNKFDPPKYPGMRRYIKIAFLMLALTIITACRPSQPETISPVIQTTQPNLPLESTTPVVTQPTSELENPQITQAVEATDSSVDATALPAGYVDESWKSLPIFPDSISDKMREVYQKGLAMGNDPRSFIRVGDCHSKNPDFLAGFDGKYNLGEYTYLQPTIDYFKGAFGRYNQTANPGNTTSRLVVSFWNNGDCLANEPMLECQFRLDNPSIAFISLGTIDAKYDYKFPTSFERNLRRIIEKTLEEGIVPILVTKADNLEGDYSINATVARLAAEYEVPLWNFWRSAQALEHAGLDPDMEHLNFLAGPPSTDFSSPYSLYYGKEVRNLNGLQMLDFLLKELGVFPNTPTPVVNP